MWPGDGEAFHKGAHEQAIIYRTTGGIGRGRLGGKGFSHQGDLWIRLWTPHKEAELKNLNIAVIPYPYRGRLGNNLPKDLTDAPELCGGEDVEKWTLLFFWHTKALPHPNSFALYSESDTCLIQTKVKFVKLLFFRTTWVGINICHSRTVNIVTLLLSSSRWWSFLTPDLRDGVVNWFTATPLQYLLAHFRVLQLADDTLSKPDCLSPRDGSGCLQYPFPVRPSKSIAPRITMAIAIRKKRFKLENRHYNITSAASGPRCSVIRVSSASLRSRNTFDTPSPNSRINVRAIFHSRFSLYYYFVPAGAVMVRQHAAPATSCVMDSQIAFYHQDAELLQILREILFMYNYYWNVVNCWRAILLCLQIYNMLSLT